jgi:mannose-6-phosphate isomerase-like protein (cupin superfamily)
MIRAGDSIVNPVTGERIVFELTSHDTDGAYTRFEMFVESGGSVASAHVHPFQTELFAVVEGTLGVKRGRETLELGPGEVAMVDPGVAHSFWNAGKETLRFRAEVRPALQFESLVETMFGLALDGKTNAKGMPAALRLAVIAHHHFDVVRLPVVPYVLQKLALGGGSLLGKALGYSPTYEPLYRGATRGTPGLA